MIFYLLFLHYCLLNFLLGSQIYQTIQFFVGFGFVSVDFVGIDLGVVEQVEQDIMQIEVLGIENTVGLDVEEVDNMDKADTSDMVEAFGDVVHYVL